MIVAHNIKINIPKTNDGVYGSLYFYCLCVSCKKVNNLFYYYVF